MSEATLIVSCEFGSTPERDLAVRLLSHGILKPAFKDELAESLWQVFETLEDTLADDVAKKGTKELELLFDLGGLESEKKAKTILKDLLTAGATNVFACHSPDEDGRDFLEITAESLKIIYREDDDEDFDEALWALDDSFQELALVVKKHATNKLKR